MPVIKTKKKTGKKRFVAELHITHAFTYDPESTQFKEALASYRKNVNPGGSEQDMMVHVSHNVYLSGRPDMVDGVGYVTFHGYKPPKEVEDQYTGIDLTKGLPLPDIDIISNEYI